MDPISFAPTIIAEALKMALQTFVDAQIEKQEKIAKTPENPDATPPDIRLDVKTAIGKFVTRNNEFKTHILDAAEALKRYNDKSEPKRPLNILLAAPPGSGKSFLIKEMINDINSKIQEDGKKLSFHEIYVPSISNREGVIQHLYTLCVSKEKHSTPVIFFDEVDAEIGGEHIYSNLLAPMWDGTFVYENEEHKLGKAILFFAGSSLSVEEKSDQIIEDAQLILEDKPLSYNVYYKRWFDQLVEYVNEDDQRAIKLPDFVDRIDLIIRIPPVTSVLLGDEALKEVMDVAAGIIKKNFNTVERIEQRALIGIANLLIKANTRRTAEKVVFGAELENPMKFDLLDMRPRDRLSVENELKNYERDRRNPIPKGYFVVDEIRQQKHQSSAHQ
jgi:hypothetical protein